MAPKKQHTRVARVRDQILRMERSSDAKLVAAAKTRLLAKQQPTRPQLAAWRRHVDAMDTSERTALLEATPHKQFREMAGGRQSKQIYDLNTQYGLPTRGPFVSIPAFILAVCDWFAANARKIQRLKAEDDDDVGGDNSPALERLRAAKAQREEFAYERDLDQWIRRDAVHEALTILAGLLRGAGDRLQRGHGREAHAILDEALVAGDKLMQARFGPQAKVPRNGTVKGKK